MRRVRSVVAGALSVLGVALLVSLGVWQLERRVWKLQLIERVDRRVHAPVSNAPGVGRWSSVSAAADEYRHVQISGEYELQGQALVQALTRLGGGFWVMTPLRAADGGVVFINRGFVPAEIHDQPSHFQAPSGVVTVAGLLRISEPRGTLLRHNVPSEQRWYSRDVGALAQTAGLAAAAPYFIDAQVSPSDRRYPVAGLTVISFPNNHLLYAITWFTLAALGVGTLVAGRRQQVTPAVA